MKGTYRLILITLILTILTEVLCVPSAPVHAQSVLTNYPVIPSITGSVASQVQALVQQGKQQGNRLNVFSKIGDSMTEASFFLTPIGNGRFRLGSYADLADTVDYFSTEIARTNNSFANKSLAARKGWTTVDLLNPRRTISRLCNVDESPLECELRVVKPAIALIMIGTNELPKGDVDSFRERLTEIIGIVKAHGVVPVLSTLPNRRDSNKALGNVEAFNLVIAELSTDEEIPLWNYWLALEPLPANGLGRDNVHPNIPKGGGTAVFDDDHLQYGYTVRNLTALQVLNALRPVLQ